MPPNDCAHSRRAHETPTGEARRFFAPIRPEIGEIEAHREITVPAQADDESLVSTSWKVGDVCATAATDSVLS